MFNTPPGTTISFILVYQDQFIVIGMGLSVDISDISGDPNDHDLACIWHFWHDKPSCLYGADPEEGDIEAAVEGEPDQVEGEEVKVEANHADVGNFNHVGNCNFDFFKIPWK